MKTNHYIPLFLTMRAMNIFPISSLLTFLLLCLLSLSMCIQASTVEYSSSLFERLPQELLDSTLSYLSAQEYYKFRMAFPGIYLSELAELVLISRGVSELRAIDCNNYHEFLRARYYQETLQSLLFGHVFARNSFFQSLRPKYKARFIEMKLRLLKRMGLENISEMLLSVFMVDSDFIRIWKRVSEKFLYRTILQASVLAGNTKALGFFLGQSYTTALEMRRSLIRLACTRRSLKTVAVILEWPWTGRSSDFLLFTMNAAIDQDHVELIDFIFQHDCGTGRLKDGVITLIFYAIQGGRMEALEFLIAKLDQNKIPKRQKFMADLNSSLAIAGYNGNLAAIKRIIWSQRKDSLRKIVFGIKLEKLDVGTIVRCAAQNGRLEIVEFFCSRAEKLCRLVPWKYVNECSFIQAATGGHLAVLWYLLGHDRQTETLVPLKNLGVVTAGEALIAAASNGHFKVVQFIVLERLEIDTNDSLWLHFIQQAFLRACRQGHLEIVKLFLGWDETGKPQFPAVNNALINKFALRMTVYAGHFKVVEFLLSRHDGQFIFPGVEPGRKKSLVVELAVRSKSLAMLGYLLQKDENGQYLLPGIDLSSRNQTILEIAAQIRDVRVLQLLLQRDSHGSFMHAALDPLGSSINLLYNAIQAHNCGAVLVLIERDSRGHFLYPELLLEENFYHIMECVGRAYCGQIRKIILNAFQDQPIQ